MKKNIVTAVISTLILFVATAINAQKTISTGPKKIVTAQPATLLLPHLTLKTSYATQQTAKVQLLQKNGNLAKKFPDAKLSPSVLGALRSANEFIAVYKTRNMVVAPPGISTSYTTYLRIGPYSLDYVNGSPGSDPHAKDQVMSTLFNDAEQSFLLADKDFTNRYVTNTQLPKDMVASWTIEYIGDGWTIQSLATKKYLCLTPSGGFAKVGMTENKSEQGVKWMILVGTDDGITFYNNTYGAFLGRKLIGRKVFLLPFRYQDYSNVTLRQGVNISWDLYRTDMLDGGPMVCSYKLFNHSYRYMMTRPVADLDADGAICMACGGDDCDDFNPNRYPGNREVCDPAGLDEDCNMDTFGAIDLDHDGYISVSCFNLTADGTLTIGTDCDDSNPAIYPGQQKYVDDHTVDVCGSGLYTVEAGYMAVRQPNGTAIVVPRR